MSEAPSIKNEDTKAVRHFEENNFDGDDLHATATKSISLFIAYERLKSPPQFIVHFLVVT